jgi:CHAD domain-containing protein
MTTKKKQIFKTVNKRLHKINKSYEEYQKNPYIPAHVHRLRVNLRKLRAILNFLKPVIGSSTYDEINKILRDIGKKLSPLRDLDTLIEECTEVAYEQPALVDNYADVFKFLHKERMKLIDNLSKREVFDTIEEKIVTVANILDGIQLDEKNLKTFVKERFDHKVNKLEKQYKSLDKKDYENVHDVRKQAKKVRYTAAGLKKSLPRKEAKKVKKYAKKIQKNLGELTDAYVMVDLLQEYKEKTSKKELDVSFKTFIDYYSSKVY